MLAGQDTEGAREPGCSIDFISFVQRQGVLMVILENLIRREMDRGMPENSIGTIRSREFCVGFGDWSGRPAGAFLMTDAENRNDRLAWVGCSEITVEGITLQLRRSEEHTSELQSIMRISYAVFCL